MRAKTYNVLQILILIYSSRQEKLPRLSEKRAPEPALILQVFTFGPSLP